MLDNKLLRHDLGRVAKLLNKKGFHLDEEKFHALEGKRKTLQIKTEHLQNQRNTASREIGIAKQQGLPIEPLKKQVQDMNEALLLTEKALQSILSEQEHFLLSIPNLPQESVPEGSSDGDNIEIKKWGAVRQFNFTPKDHVLLTEQNQGLDFKIAAKISGARFVVMRHAIARMHRALTQFMLSLHIKNHGYEEVYVPYIVNGACLVGSGQWPKLKEDSFVLEGGEQALIPTAEVPLINLVKDQILPEEALPLKFVAHTPCFRKEAGSYGKDTRGMLRHHQFDKVELVQIVLPEHAEEAHEAILTHAETVLQALKLPYRVVNLCGGDLGFAMTKTYDIEVWLPGEQRYREISSCSNAQDFQARRIKARFKRKGSQKTEYLHTLNGSGLAVGRTLIAVLENYQQANGEIEIPEALKPYLD